MPAMGDVASIVLGVVFAWSSVAKAFMGRRWPESLRRLELPTVLAWPLVGIELVFAVVLVAVEPWRRSAAIGAAALLAVMTVVLVDRLRRGVRPPCACFGGASVRPLSWREPVRNFVLLAVAFVAALS
jgi:hypothetical protein